MTKGSIIPVILVLGSLPGDESIRWQEYYGSPRNMYQCESSDKV